MMAPNKCHGQRPVSYTQEELLEACLKFQSQEMSASQASTQYKVPISTIYYVVKNRPNVLEAYTREKQEKQLFEGKKRRTEGRAKLESKEEKGCKMSVKTSRSKSEVCLFCGVGACREEELGKLYEQDGIRVHYYCLLFSSGLAQNGDDEEGIMGFLCDDIEKEIQRGKRLPCSYCLKKGATIGCNKKKCRRTYHYPCGIQHFALCMFSGDFRSYCVDHRNFQKGLGVGEQFECPICMDDLIANPKEHVWAPCCKRRSWFHKLCLQKLALSAGYFFKCPLCNDKEKFLTEMQKVGIFVPEKDASWELEPNAFSELLARPVHCDAPKCRCPSGRKTDDDGTRWEILLCHLCGSTGMHIACGDVPFTCTEWTCPVCAGMMADSVRRLRQDVRQTRLKQRTERLQTLHNSASDVSQPSEDAGMDGGQGGVCRTNSPGVIDSEASPVDVTSTSRTPCKRKLGVVSRTEVTPHKICHTDLGSPVTKISDATDSEEEIDIESGEWQAPPHTIIRELVEHGEELPKKLQLLKDHALRAQERMLELHLNERDVVRMAKACPQYKLFPLDKSDLVRFYRSNLPLEKMLQILKLLKVVFALREAVVAEAQSSSAKKKGQATSAKKKKAVRQSSTRRRRKAAAQTSTIRVPMLKSALSESLAAAAKSPKDTAEKLEDVSGGTSSLRVKCPGVKKNLRASLDATIAVTAGGKAQADRPVAPFPSMPESIEGTKQVVNQVHQSVEDLRQERNTGLSQEEHKGEATTYSMALAEKTANGLEDSHQPGGDASSQGPPDRNVALTAASGSRSRPKRGKNCVQSRSRNQTLVTDYFSPSPTFNRRASETRRFASHGETGGGIISRGRLPNQHKFLPCRQSPVGGKRVRFDVDSKEVEGTLSAGSCQKPRPSKEECCDKNGSPEESDLLDNSEMAKNRMKNMLPCCWDKFSLEQKESGSASDPVIDTPVKPGSARLLEKCPDCVVVLELLSPMRNAVKIEVVANNIIKVVYKNKAVFTQLKTPALLQKLYLAAKRR